MSPLLSPAELTLLARCDLAHRRPLQGVNAGERRSPRTARSAEFADFRPYASGDDFRQIDWRAYARLERLMLRLYVAEDEVALNVIVDSSASMTLGEPSKWSVARKLAAAVAFVGLGALDRVAVGTLAGAFTPHLRGPSGAARITRFLEQVEPGGSIAPEALNRIRWMRPGVTVIVSDFLVEGSWAEPLARLRRDRQEPILWQVLSREEESPGTLGDFRFEDVEAAGTHDLTVTATLIEEYDAALELLRGKLRQAASAGGGRFLHSANSDDLEAAMLAGMRAGVVVRR